jgi:hypothetical protein
LLDEDEEDEESDFDDEPLDSDDDELPPDFEVEVVSFEELEDLPRESVR